MEVILVFFEELEGSAVGLTVSVGRNDYKGYKLFCNGFFHEWHSPVFFPLVIPVLPPSKSSPGLTRGSLGLPGQARQ